jgi:hypothetical protein
LGEIDLVVEIGENQCDAVLFWKNVLASELPDGIHIFKTKNPNFGKFWRVLQWNMLVYFTAIWSILRPFGQFYGHLVYYMAIFVVLWYNFSHFGMLYPKDLATLVGLTIFAKSS